MTPNTISRSLAKNVNRLLCQLDIDELAQQVSSGQETIQKNPVAAFRALPEYSRKIRASLDTDKLFKITAPRNLSATGRRAGSSVSVQRRLEVGQFVSTIYHYR